MCGSGEASGEEYMNEATPPSGGGCGKNKREN